MINRIVEAISLALNNEFGDGYKIYTEEVTQGMENPCFFILCRTPKNTQFFNKKYFRSNMFCIQYIPSSENVKTECNAVTEQLFQCLEYLWIDGSLIRGTKMEPEMKDGILFFFLNYDFFVYKKEETETMGALSEHIDAKG